MNTLSKQVRNKLLEIQQQLLIKQCVEKASSLKAMQELQAWCEYHDIACDLQFSANQLLFTREVIEQIKTALVELQQLPLQESSQVHDRYSQAAQAYEENKSLGAAPREFRVLCMQVDGEQEPVIFVDRDYRDIALTEYSCLICVENLDTFYEFHQRHRLLAHSLLKKPLIIYRGDHIYSKGCAVLIKLCQQQQLSCLYYGDFDIAGLHIALTLQCSHLLLPGKHFLQDKASDKQFASEQVHLFPAVLAFEQKLAYHHESKLLLQILTQEKRALKQQWFAKELQVYSIRLE